MPTDAPTRDVLADAIRQLANALLVVIVHRGQVSHLDRDLRARLSQLVRSVLPPPATPPP